jgi:signal transduction histidine kinase
MREHGDSGRAAGSSLRTVVNTVVGVLLVTLVVSALVTAAVRHQVRAEVAEVRSTLLPARSAVKALAAAHHDQELGVRGYLLSGESGALEPWQDGNAEATAAHDDLRALLDDDSRALALLAEAEQQGESWRRELAEPSIDARAPGGGASEADRARAETVVDGLAAVTEADAALLDHVEARLDDGLAAVDTWQRVADLAAYGAVGVGVAVACFTVLFLRRRLTRPLEQLLGQVQDVATDPSASPVVAAGPSELRRIGTAVEQMRVRLLRSSDDLVHTQRRLAVVEERDRLAADIHDLVIQRVFGLGLALTAEQARHPEHAAQLDPLVDETDKVIRDLRTVIFDIRRPAVGGGGFRESVSAVVQDSIRPLGFKPELSFVGPVESAVDEALAQDLLAALQEALSNVARHANADAATVCLSVSGDQIRLEVADTGTTTRPAGSGPGHGLRNLRQRAERRGGQCRLDVTGTGTLLRWQVPFAAPVS